MAGRHAFTASGGCSHAQAAINCKSDGCYQLRLLACASCLLHIQHCVLKSFCFVSRVVLDRLPLGISLLAWS